MSRCKRGRFSLWLILAATMSVASMEDYYLSYRLQTDRGMVVLDRVRLSRAMVPLQPQKPICRFFLKHPSPSALHEPLVRCLMHQKVWLHAYADVFNGALKTSQTLLVVPPMPICIKTDRGNVTIWQAKEGK